MSLIICAIILYIAVTIESIPEIVWVAIEKDCKSQGQSIGRLEWRVFKDGYQIVARCDIVHDESRLNYAIVWTYNHGNRKKTLKSCDSVNDMAASNDAFHCEYRVNLRKPKNKTNYTSMLFDLPENDPKMNVTCWIKTFDDWKSENKTWCTSDEIALWNVYHDSTSVETPERKRALELAHDLIATHPLKKPGYKPPFGWEVMEGLPDTEPYGRYLVQVLEANKSTHCVESGLVLQIGVFPMLDMMPQSLMFFCRATFEKPVNYTGNFTLSLNKKNVSWKYPMVLPMKTCFRFQTSFYLPHTCEASFPLTRLDLGVATMSCMHTEISRGDTGQTQNLPEPCLSDEIMFNVTGDIKYLPRLEKIIYEYKTGRPSREWILGPDGVWYIPGRPNLTRTIRDELPYDTRPPPGNGTRLNGTQMVYMGSGATTLFLVISTACAIARFILGHSKREMQKEPCLCRKPEPIPVRVHFDALMRER